MVQGRVCFGQRVPRGSVCMKNPDGCRQKQHCCVFFMSARPLMAARSISGSFDADLWASSLGRDFARQNVGKSRNFAAACFCACV